MSGLSSGCLRHDRQVHVSDAPGLRGAVVRYPGKQQSATATGYLRCIVGDAVRLTVRWAASGRFPVRAGFDERSYVDLLQVCAYGL